MTAAIRCWLTPDEAALAASMMTESRAVIQIAEEVADATGMMVDRILHCGRTDRRAMSARNLVWSIAHRRAGLSLNQIANVTGHDHTTVLHGIRKHEASA